LGVTVVCGRNQRAQLLTLTSCAFIASRRQNQLCGNPERLLQVGRNECLENVKRPQTNRPIMHHTLTPAEIWQESSIFSWWILWYESSASPGLCLL